VTYAADLHLHSSFARATSPSLDLPLMTRWTRVKGIDLIASSDFTHPVWLDRLERAFVSTGDGLFRLAPIPDRGPDENALPKIILGTEVTCIYPQGGRSHRVHLLLFAPDFATVHRLCDVLAMALEINPRCEVILAHA